MHRAAAKKELAALDRLRVEPFEEGLLVQIMYFGAFDDESPTIERLHQFAFDQGYALSGKHHDIYLSDLCRTVPEKRKTVLCQPIKKVD